MAVPQQMAPLPAALPVGLSLWIYEPPVNSQCELTVATPARQQKNRTAIPCRQPKVGVPDVRPFSAHRQNYVRTSLLQKTT